MAVQHEKVNSDEFVGLKSPAGRVFVSRDSGERGTDLQDSMKDRVPNPEAKATPVPKLSKTGQHQK